MKWSGRLTDKYYSVVWGINFPEIADKYNMPRDKVDEIFQHYRTTFSRGSFTRDEFKTNRLKLKKDDDLQLDGVCESFFKKYDKENTGEIKFANYVEMLNVQFYGTVEQKLALLFELIDQDGNKYISERELADMLTATFHMKGKSEPRTKAEALASRIFSVAHQDIAGQLTLDQFKCVAHEQSLFSDIYEVE